MRKSVSIESIQDFVQVTLFIETIHSYFTVTTLIPCVVSTKEPASIHYRLRHFRNLEIRIILKCSDDCFSIACI